MATRKPRNQKAAAKPSASPLPPSPRGIVDTVLPLLEVPDDGIDATVVQTASFVETVELLAHKPVLACLLGRFSDTLLLVDPDHIETLQRAMLNAGITADWRQA